MNKKIVVLFLFMLAFTNLQAGHNKRHQHRHENDKLEGLTTEEREEVIDLQIELIQKESELNREIRKVRMEINRCSREKEIDMDKYSTLQNKAKMLRDDREELRREDRKSVV